MTKFSDYLKLDCLTKILLHLKDKTVADVKLLKTKFSGPKKEKREKGKLSENVKKFLEHKEAEEKKMKMERKLEAKKLQDLRSDREKK